MQNFRRNVTSLLVSLFSLSLLAIPGGGCSGGSGGGGTTGTTTFEGTVALNDGTVGTLNLTVQSAVATTSGFSLIREAKAQTSDTVPATGDCITPTCTVSLSGTENTSTGEIDVSGTGGTGTGCSTTTTTGFTGTVTPPSGTSGGSMSGNITSTPVSGGTPTTVGSFSALPATPGNPVVKYCGNYSDSGESGTFNVQVDADGNIGGSAVSSNPNESGVSFRGTSTGTTFTMCSSGQNSSKPICGQIQSDGTVIGRYRKDNGIEGCFIGNSTACTSGGAPTCGGPTAVCTYPTCS